MHDHSSSSWPFWLSLGGGTVDQCMGSSWLQSVIIILCAGVLIGYGIIARDWHQLEQLTENRQGKTALRSLRNIFIFCGICGYGMVIVRSMIPAWSPTIVLMACLNLVTWKYISQLHALTEIHRDAATLEQLKQAAARKIEGETALETAARCKILLDAHLQRMDDA